MPWGYAATAVGSYFGSKSKGGGGGGGSSNAYVPKEQAAMDQAFIDATKTSKDALAQMWGQVSPYNQQLLQNAFNNPYANVNQAAADQASAALSGITQANQNIYGQNMRDYQDLVGAADRRNKIYQMMIDTAGQRTSALDKLNEQSNQNFNSLIGYQKGQLGDITGAQKNLYGGGNQILQTALDPQQALYNRTLGQITDQARAAQYARGIQDTPYGAALENASNQNFNIDWQNQQLARQTQGLQAAQGAYGSAQNMGNAYTQNVGGLQSSQNQNYANLADAAQRQLLTAVNAEAEAASRDLQNKGYAQGLAQNTGGQVVSGIQGVGQIPYNTYNQAQSNQAQALQNYQNAYSPYLAGQSNLQGQYLNYLGYGSGAQANAFNQNAYNQQQRANAISSISGPLAEGLGKGADSFFNNSDWGNSLYNSWFSGSL